MKAIVSEKDVCRVESYLATDVAGFSLFSSQGEDGRLDVETGSDGNFKVMVNYNQDLSPEEKILVHKKEKAIVLTIDGPLYIGSTEWMDDNVTKALKDNWVDVLEAPSGRYLVDTYSLLTRDEEGKPKYLQFVFCIFPEDKYPKAEGQPHSINKPISLRYSE